MSEYGQFLQECEQIDLMLATGYEFKKVIETLDGTFIQFEKKQGKSKELLVENLLIQTANARKYFAAKLIQQQKENVEYAKAKTHN